VTYLEKFGDTLPIRMLNSHQVSCAGGCGKTIRITKSQFKRNIDRCRTCYPEVARGQSRPIPGREKVKRVHVRKAKAVQQPKKEKRGKRKGGQEATD